MSRVARCNVLLILDLWLPRPLRLTHAHVNIHHDIAELLQSSAWLCYRAARLHCEPDKLPVDIHVPCAAGCQL